jgi:hypothetical protein
VDFPTTRPKLPWNCPGCEIPNYCVLKQNYLQLNCDTYSARLFPFSRALEYRLLRRLVLALCFHIIWRTLVSLEELFWRAIFWWKLRRKIFGARNTNFPVWTVSPLAILQHYNVQTTLNQTNQREFVSRI